MATEITDKIKLYCTGCRHRNPEVQDSLYHQHPCVACFKGSNFSTEPKIDRIAGWRHFSDQVDKHVIQYTIPQYGNDAGNDQAANFSMEDCVQHLLTYVNRRHVRVRGNKEALRDWIKVAHWAQFIHDKLQEELKEPDVYGES